MKDKSIQIFKKCILVAERVKEEFKADQIHKYNQKINGTNSIATTPSISVTLFREENLRSHGMRLIRLFYMDKWHLHWLLLALMLTRHFRLPGDSLYYGYFE